ncbi:hypothetical protein DAI22_04g306750 [Oryza sativa Japonica Group]|nr:hypothetical protein DAI22_04g306750 [Oryza sativa Japonica Group]
MPAGARKRRGCVCVGQRRHEAEPSRAAWLAGWLLLLRAEQSRTPYYIPARATPSSRLVISSRYLYPPASVGRCPSHSIHLSLSLSLPPCNHLCIFYFLSLFLDSFLAVLGWWWWW